MSIETRLTKLETAVAPKAGFCTHAAVIRLIGDATDEMRRRFETPEVCRECGLIPPARINIILPAKMTAEDWEARYSTKGSESR